jgi:lipooligosaccharide transport system permease protein
MPTRGERASAATSAGETAGVATAAAPPPPGGAAATRVRRLEPAAIGAVLSRELAVFRRYWRSTTFSSVVEPTIFLLAFGFGFGALVSEVAGLSYIEFVGTGVVATAVLFSSVFPGLFTTFVKRRYQRTYEALLAAPIDVEELVTAEVLWLAMRAGVYGVAPLLVAMVFGLDPSPGMLLIPFIGFLTGFGFAAFGVTIAAIAKSIDNFNYVTSSVITPLFLLAGAFFPLDALPGWAATLAEANPLHHCVELVRDAAFGLRPGADLLHVGVLLAFALVMWRLAIWRLRLRLID